jgi:exopolyphosphatase/guanosine-5'-triphosphate,3'-diphosphate pyrophosphatase
VTRIAVIDVGTNTARLLVAELAGPARVEELLRESNVTRLGSQVERRGRLDPEAIERTMTVLADYVQRAEELGAQRRIAVMTSAVREAADGRRFAADASERHGLEVHVLSGEQEARLTYLGATDGEAGSFGQDDERLLVLDIGGGSTELVVGHGTTVDFHVSTRAGVVRQADRHIAHDPPASTEREALAADVRATLAEGVPPPWRAGVRRAIAVAGTPTSLAAILQRLEPYDPLRVHGYRIALEEVQRVRRRLETMTLRERRRVPGLHPDRAITIVPGLIILEEAMELFGLEQVEASEHDILRGAVLALGGEPR